MLNLIYLSKLYILYTELIMSDNNKSIEDDLKNAAKKAKDSAKNFAKDLDENTKEFQKEAKNTAEEFTQGAKEAYEQLTDSGGSKRILIGILAIFFGTLGIHKFVLGYTKEGLIMLVISVFTLGFGAWFMGLAGLIEGIIYLTKSDEEFYNTYQVGKKPWF